MFRNAVSQKARCVELFRPVCVALVVSGIGLAVTPGSRHEGQPAGKGAAPHLAQAPQAEEVGAALGPLPLMFIENRGQVDLPVAYYVQASDTALYLTSHGVTFSLAAEAEPQAGVEAPDEAGVAHAAERVPDAPAKRWTVKLDFVGANPDVEPVGQDPTGTVVSYFKGSPDQWQTGLKTFARVVYPDLWPGIDLIYSGANSRLDYKFVVQPGADPGQIKLAYRGATGVKLAAGGSLEVATPAGPLSEAAPIAFQELAGGSVPVAAAYRLESKAGSAEQVYGFQLARHDYSGPLNIQSLGTAKVVLAPSSQGSPSTASSLRRAVWMYGFPDTYDEGQVPLLSSLAFNSIYLSVNTDSLTDATYADKLAAFVTEAHAHGMTVHGMTLEDGHFAFTENKATAIQKIQALLAYNNVHPAAALDGIHIDTEPHALSCPGPGNQDPDCDPADYQNYGHSTGLSHPVGTFWTIPDRSLTVELGVAKGLTQVFTVPQADSPIYDTDGDGDLLEEVVLSGPAASNGATVTAVTLGSDSQPASITVTNDSDVYPASLTLSWQPETDRTKWTRRDGIMADYVDMLDALRAEIGAVSPAVEFSAAIAWWYNEEAGKCTVASDAPPCGNSEYRLPAGATVNLLSRLDTLVPMSFLGSAASGLELSEKLNRVASRAADEIASAPTVVGVNAAEYGNYAEVRSVLDYLDGRFGDPASGAYSANYLGTVVFHHELLRAQADTVARESAYAGYVGGADGDFPLGIAVDEAGNAYVTGYTLSLQDTFPAGSGFGAVPGWVQTQGGGYDAFVVKIRADGTGLDYATYIGGDHFDQGFGIAVDGGMAYVSGTTSSTPFPTAGGPDTTHNGGRDAFIIKLDQTGTELLYSGFIGGTGDDYGYGVAVDDDHGVYVSGTTASDEGSFPDTQSGGFTGMGGSIGGFDKTYNGGSSDAFVAKVTAGGAGLEYATFIGGAALDSAGYNLAVDSGGKAYVVGRTASGQDTFPGGEGLSLDDLNILGAQQVHGGGNDSFVVRVKADGLGLGYATYFGGGGNDEGRGIAVDDSGSAYIVGETFSTNLPVKGGPDLFFNGGGRDAFVAKLKADGSALEYAGYIGGSLGEDGNGIALDDAGHAYVTGLTYSSQDSFPAIGGPDVTYNGSADAFVAKVSPTGGNLVYAGYLGDGGGNDGLAIAVDPWGNAYAALTSYGGMPVQVGPDLQHNGSVDVYVAKISDPGFSDDFEYDRGWTMEEIEVSQCYSSPLGQVARVAHLDSNSQPIAVDGTYSLLVSANEQATSNGNYVMARNMLSSRGRGSGVWRYEAYAYIPPDVADYGLAGPVLLVENTLYEDGQYITREFGVRYEARPGPTKGTWSVLGRQADGTAAWRPFLTEELSPGKWYYVAVEADFNDDGYHRFWLRGRDVDVNVSYDLSCNVIAKEAKGWTNEGLRISVAAESLSSCAYPGVVDHKYNVYYDTVSLSEIPDALALGPADPHVLSPLDLTFDTDGLATAGFGDVNTAFAAAIQPDGKIVAAGFRRIGAGEYDLAVARYCPDGRLDDGATCGGPGFGIGGRVTTDLRGWDIAYDVAIQEVGGESRIVVAGESDGDFALVRYCSDGELDNGINCSGDGFGDDVNNDSKGDGQVVIDFGGKDVAYGVAVGSNAIVAAGYTMVAGDRDLALARLDQNGVLDPGFDSDGQVTTELGTDSQEVAWSVAVDGNDIVVAGNSNVGGSADFLVARYTMNGTLDTSFGDNRGWVTTGFDDVSQPKVDRARDVAIMDGKYMVVGYSTASGGTDFALARYCHDGRLDDGLNCGTGGLDGDGLVTTDLGGENDVGNAVALQADGRIVVAGWTNAGGTYDLAVVRYLTDGTPDPSFGTDGVATSDFGALEAARDVAIDGDGNIVAAGESADGFGLVRYRGDEGFIWPLQACSRNAPFGPRVNYKRWDFHDGLDLPAPIGTPVYAVRGGTVLRAGPADGTYSSRHVVVKSDHPSRIDSTTGEKLKVYAVYLHLASNDVTAGESVLQGQRVGTVGDDGAAYSHLHIELREGAAFEVNSVHPLGADYLPYSDSRNFTAPVLDRANQLGDLLAVRLLFDAPDRFEGDLRKVAVKLDVESTAREVDLNDKLTINEGNGDDFRFTKDIALEGYQKSNMEGDARSDLQYGILVRNIPSDANSLTAQVTDVGGNVVPDPAAAVPIPIATLTAMHKAETFAGGVPSAGWQDATSGAGATVEAVNMADHTGVNSEMMRTSVDSSAATAGIEIGLAATPVKRFEWVAEGWFNPTALDLPNDKNNVYVLHFLGGSPKKLSVAARIRNDAGTYRAGIVAQEQSGDNPLTFVTRGKTSDKATAVISLNEWRHWRLHLLRLGTRESTAVLYIDGSEQARLNWDSSTLDPHTFRAGVGFTSSGASATLLTDDLRLTEQIDRSAPPSSGLRSRWPGDGNAKDVQPAANHGALQAGATFAPGRVKQAFSLDGGGAYVAVTDPATATDPDDARNLDGFDQLTISAWVKPSDLSGGYRAMVTKYDDTSGGGISYHLSAVSDGKLEFEVCEDCAAGGTKWVRVTSPQIALNPGAFSHVAAVWRGGEELALYVNGTQVQNLDQAKGGAAVPVNLADTDVPVNIGRFEARNQVPAGSFAGLIDEVALYHRALSVAEITALYEAASWGPGSFHASSGNDADADGLGSAFESGFGGGGIEIVSPETGHVASATGSATDPTGATVTLGSVTVALPQYTEVLGGGPDDVIAITVADPPTKVQISGADLPVGTKAVTLAFDGNAANPLVCIADTADATIETIVDSNGTCSGTRIAIPSTVGASTSQDVDGNGTAFTVTRESTSPPRVMVAGLTHTALGTIVDFDMDGIQDANDACPANPGPVERQGCPVADANTVTLHIIDHQKPRSACPGGAGSCEAPIAGAEVRVFDRNDPGFQALWRKNPKGGVYDLVYEDGTGRVAGCTTDDTGSCLAGEETAGDYLVIVKYVDDDPAGDAFTGTVYTGKPKGPEDFVDTDGDGQGDLATKEFQIIKVFKKDGTVRIGGGSKTVLTGSLLEIIAPAYAVWEEAATDYVYPLHLPGPRRLAAWWRGAAGGLGAPAFDLCEAPRRGRRPPDRARVGDLACAGSKMRCGREFGQWLNPNGLR